MGNDSPVHDQRLRFGRLMILAGAPFFYGYAFYFWTEGLLVAAAATLFGALSITAVLLFYLVRPFQATSDRAIRRIALVCVFVPLFIHDFSLVWISGRLEFTPWLFLYPPLAFYLLGERNGIVVLLALAALVALGGVCGLVRPLESVRPVDPAAILVQLTVAMVVSGLIAWISERTRRQALDSLQESREELRAAREELERRVLERTAALDQTNARLSAELKERKRLEERLVQAQKMESIGTLAGGIAHDFNNILQMISGYTSLVLSEMTERGPDHEALTIVMAATERATQLARQLLLFGRHEGSDLRPLDLNAQVTEMIRLLTSTIPKMILIEAYLAEDLERVNADAGQMQQVIMNLAVNARDAMPEGGRLTFETRNITLDKHFADEHPGALAGKHVRLSVLDTGAGMDEETQRRIYDPFFTTKERGKGTGLGLAVVYGIIASHGGYITCSSKRGEGTKFDVFLPASDRQTDEDRAPVPEESKAQGGTERILCVDDDPHVLGLESTVLARKGYLTTAASSGEEALSRYTESAPDLVILDLDMPGIGGYRCFKELLRIDPQVTVIIASGYAGGHLPEDLLSQGVAALLTKPFTTEALLRQVRTALDRTETRA